ncbi:hypothetical protein BC940DRAFT_292326 [Gongronella butleri]|nr:hypothetical protein BC940DRAFT_292326 [Gongronella butleri]
MRRSKCIVCSQTHLLFSLLVNCPNVCAFRGQKKKIDQKERKSGLYSHGRRVRPLGARLQGKWHVPCAPLSSLTSHYSSTRSFAPPVSQ